MVNGMLLMFSKAAVENTNRFVEPGNRAEHDVCGQCKGMLVNIKYLTWKADIQTYYFLVGLKIG